MGLESAPGSALGQINPASLTGQAAPVVEPRAVAALADAFRGGQISANDIHDRVSERAKAKEKMDIVLANRATAEAEDPALIEARRQQMLAAGAQGQLASAQAGASLPNVAEAEALKMKIAQNAAQLEKYPMAAVFDKLGPKYSVPEPRNPDGSIDYAKKSELGAKLVAHDAKLENAKSEWNAISKIPSADNTEIIEGVTPQGKKLTPAELKIKEDATKESFFKIAPGTVVTPVDAAAAPTLPVVTPDLRSAGEGDSDLVQPLPAPAPVQLPTISTGVAPAGTKTAQGFSLGPPKPTAGDGGIKMTGEQASTIAKNNFTKDLFDVFKVRQKELEAGSPWLFGPVAGWISKGLMSQNWDVPVHNFESSKTAILAPMVKGVFQETGVLSQKDVDRYDKVLPAITQTAEVQKEAIDNLERYIYDSIVTNFESFPAQGIKPTPQATAFYEEALRRKNELKAGGQTITDAVSGSKPAAVPTTTPVAAPTAVQTLSTGKKAVRDAQGNMVLVK